MKFENVKIEKGTDVGDLVTILKKAQAKCGILAYWDEDGLTLLGYHFKSKYRNAMKLMMSRFSQLYERSGTGLPDQPNFRIENILEGEE